MKTNYVQIGCVDESFVLPFINYLVQFGLSERNPVSGKITIFGDDGSPILVDFLSGVELEVCSGMQLWISPSEDIYVSWERIDVGIGVFLDGLGKDDVMRISRLCCVFSCEYSVKNDVAIKIELSNQSAQ